MTAIEIDITVETHIAAPPDDVYALVADLARMGEWSPENSGGEWIAGGPGQVGARFLGHNRTATETWDGIATVTAADGTHLEWVMGDDLTNPQGTWRYTFEAAEDGTHVIERYLLGPGPSGFRDELAGHTDDIVATIVDLRRDQLHASMRTTLARLKTAAECLASTSEFAAMRCTLAALHELLDSMRPDAWTLPTRCDPLDVTALVAHIAGSFTFVRSWLTTTPRNEPRLDRATMWRAFPNETRAMVVDAAVAGHDDRTADDALSDLQRAVQAFIGTAAPLPRTALAACDAFGPDFVLPARDVIANRVLEVGVHLLDLQAAVDVPEHLPDCAAPIVTAILDGLRGAPLPEPIAWSPTRYALVGTGRAKPTPSDLSALAGDTAPPFPLLT